MKTAGYRRQEKDGRAEKAGQRRQGRDGRITMSGQRLQISGKDKDNTITAPDKDGRIKNAGEGRRGTCKEACSRRRRARKTSGGKAPSSVTE